MGFVVLGVLTALTGAAALCLTARAGLRGRAESLVAATLLWNLLVALPIYALGFAGRLTPGPLGVAAALTALVAIGAAAGGSAAGLRRVSLDARALAAGLARLPRDLLITTWRARSPLLPGVVVALVMMPYLAVAAYLGPPFPYWDGLWYHESIVGFTIQNHGFAAAVVPESLQKVNGYPRLGEMTMLWFTIFTDHRLIDLANLLFAPALGAGTYALCRQLGAGALASIGWAAALVLMPVCPELYQSTFVDPQNAALLLGAIVFAARPAPLSAAEALLAAVGLALAIGSKTMSLAPAGVLGILIAVRVLREGWRVHRGRALATLAAGAALILAMTAAVYLRNLKLFGNPFWPDLRVDVPALGIHWPGLLSWTPDPAHPNADRLDMNGPWLDLIGHLLALPRSVKARYFDQAVDYGAGVAWVVFPLGALAWAASLAVAARRGFARVRRGPRPPSVPADAAALLLAGLVFVIVKASPALWCPRYHIVTVALLMALLAWLAVRTGWERAGEAAAAAVLVTSFMMLWWVPEPRWWPSPAKLLAEARTPYPQREVDRALGVAIDTSVGLARERELTAGAVLVFNERYGGFPALFWNNDVSNRVVYVKGGADFLARAAAAGATWVFLSDRDPQLAAARAPKSGWQEVGILNTLNTGRAFRRAPR